MDYDILAHGGRSSDSGSTEKDLYKHWHGDHGRGICNTSQRAKLECGEGTMPGLVILDSMERIEAAPLAISRKPLSRTPSLAGLAASREPTPRRHYHHPRRPGGPRPMLQIRLHVFTAAPQPTATHLHGSVHDFTAPLRPRLRADHGKRVTVACPYHHVGGGGCRQLG
jgi:hypothetical protein